MRTTLDINDALLIAARQQAVRSRQTLTAFVEAALRRQLGTRTQATRAPEIPVLPGGGVRPGVDLTDNAALLDLLEDGKPGR